MSVLSKLNVGDTFKLEFSYQYVNNFYPQTRIEYNKIDYRGPLYFKCIVEYDSNTINMYTTYKTDFTKTKKDYIVSNNFIYSLRDRANIFNIGKNYIPQNIMKFYKNQIPLIYTPFIKSDEDVISYILDHRERLRLDSYRISNLSRIDKIKIALI